MFYRAVGVALGLLLMITLVLGFLVAILWLLKMLVILTPSLAGG